MATPFSAPRRLEVLLLDCFQPIEPLTAAVEVNEHPSQVLIPTNRIHQLLGQTPKEKPVCAPQFACLNSLSHNSFHSEAKAKAKAQEGGGVHLLSISVPDWERDWEVIIYMLPK
jgi:hypothetical protein